MLTIRTAAQIRGARALKGFRSCAASTGIPRRHAEADRVLRAGTGLATSELRRHWLARQWETHQTRGRASAQASPGSGR